MNNKDIIFTTAFKNINRENWSNYKRSLNDYLECFLTLAKNIKYLLIVYLEPNIKHQLIQIDFNDNIIFKDMNTVNTFYDKYLIHDNNILDSEEYKNKIPSARKKKPEHCQYGYNLINHSKICFVSNTKKLYPNYKYYSWIDFGTFNQDVLNIPNQLDLNLVSEKITYSCFNSPPSQRIDPNTMLQSDAVYLAGSTFIVYFEYVDIFYNLYENKLLEFQKHMITDDDQNLILQIYFDNPDLFDLKYSNKWFTLYKENFNKLN